MSKPARTFYIFITDENAPFSEALVYMERPRNNGLAMLAIEAREVINGNTTTQTRESFWKAVDACDQSSVKTLIEDLAWCFFGNHDRPPAREADTREK